MSEGVNRPVNRSGFRAMNLFICLSLRFQVQETRSAELRVMSEGALRDFYTADLALYTHSLLQSQGGRGVTSSSLVRDHSCVIWRITDTGSSSSLVMASWVWMGL